MDLRASELRLGRARDLALVFAFARRTKAPVPPPDPLNGG